MQLRDTDDEPVLFENRNTIDSNAGNPVGCVRGVYLQKDQEGSHRHMIQREIQLNELRKSREQLKQLQPDKRNYHKGATAAVK